MRVITGGPFEYKSLDAVARGRPGRGEEKREGRKDEGMRGVEKSEERSGEVRREERKGVERGEKKREG